jgi:hypothetical protein
MPKAPKVLEEQPLTSVQSAPAFLASSIKEDAGKGVSMAAEDNLVPLIYVLQSNSPQVNKRDPDYVEEAEPGSLWLRSSGMPAINGETGILFQPCHFSKDFVEWDPASRGRFQGRHLKMPADARQIPSEKNPKKLIWRRENGNDVIETRYHIGYVLFEDGRPPMPYVIPFSSTGHTVSRGWMTLMGAKQLPGAGRAPSWACVYRLTTRQRTNDAGTWFVISVADAGWVQSAEDYNRGKALHESFERGEKGIEAPQEHPETDPDSAPF